MTIFGNDSKYVFDILIEMELNEISFYSCLSHRDCEDEINELIFQIELVSEDTGNLQDELLEQLNELITLTETNGEKRT